MMMYAVLDLVSDAGLPAPPMDLLQSAVSNHHSLPHRRMTSPVCSYNYIILKLMSDYW